MTKQDLVPLLKDLAKRDLSDCASIDDHPCMVAVRALDGCFDDIEFLKRLINNDHLGSKSKKALMILGLRYNPQW